LLITSAKELSTERNHMPGTINKVDNRQIIGGVFSKRENADKAISAFREWGVPEQDIQIVVQLRPGEAEDAYISAMVGRGFAESQTLFYDKAVREGKILVAIHNVVQPKLIIEIFDRYGAEYNPNGARNVRQDVAGMTAGAGVGAIAGGAAGAAIGGPVGAATGAAVGAIVGGGVGAGAGKAVEHRK
jgi:hypothetical protein